MPHHVPSPSEICNALARIEVSDDFRKAPQLASFLRYVVKQTLAGKASYIKGYTIAVEVLGRGADFDPSTQSIVRTEAGRLRRGLEQYYAGAGRDDPIRIELPLGSYVPLFSRRAVSPASAAATSNPEAPTTTRSGDVLAPVRWLDANLKPTQVIGIVLAALILYIAFHDLLFHSPANVPSTAAPGTPGSRSGDPVGLGEPRLLIEAISGAAAPTDRAPLDAERLRQAIIAAFARFEDIAIVANSPGHEAGAGKEEPRKVDYVMTPTLAYQQDGSARLRFRLVDTDDQTIVWQDTFPLRPDVVDRGAERDRLLRTLATTLFRPYGIIPAAERQRLKQSQTPFGCAFRAMDLGLGYEPPDQERLQRCLAGAIASNPSFGYGYLALARMKYLDYVRGYALSRETLLGAVELARKAVMVDPNSARAQGMLMIVENLRGFEPEALSAGETAIGLNPFDFRVRVTVASQLVVMGRIEQSYPLLRELRSESPIMAPPLAAALFIAAYVTGDLATATACADQLPHGELKHVAQALLAFARSDAAAAESAVAQIRQQLPSLIEDGRGVIGRFIPAQALADRLAADLAGAVQLASSKR